MGGRSRGPRISCCWPAACRVLPCKGYLPGPSAFFISARVPSAVGQRGYGNQNLDWPGLLLPGRSLAAVASVTLWLAALDLCLCPCLCLGLGLFFASADLDLGRLPALCSQPMILGPRRQTLDQCKLAESRLHNAPGRGGMAQYEVRLATASNAGSSTYRRISTSVHTPWGRHHARHRLRWSSTCQRVLLAHGFRFGTAASGTSSLAARLHVLMNHRSIHANTPPPARREPIDFCSSEPFPFRPIS